MLVPRIKKITQKRLAQLQRNANGKDYQAWRDGVLKRDDYKCQYPLCDKTEDLQVHHIRRFADAKYLKTSNVNGLTLCKLHHKQVTGNEKSYELLFFKIAIANETKITRKSDADKDISGHSGKETT